MENRLEMYEEEATTASYSGVAKKPIRFNVEETAVLEGVLPRTCHVNYIYDEEEDIPPSRRRRRRRQAVEDDKPSCNFAVCVISFVVILFIYLHIKYVVIHYGTTSNTTTTDRVRTKTTTPEKNSCSGAGDMYKKMSNVKDVVGFQYDGWCYYILHTGYKNFNDCMVEGYVLSHYFVRGKATQEYVIEKVKELGYSDTPILLGLLALCDFTGDYVWLEEAYFVDKRMRGDTGHHSLENKECNSTYWEGHMCWTLDPGYPSITEGILTHDVIRLNYTFEKVHHELCEKEIV